MKDLCNALRVKTNKEIDDLEIVLERYATEHPVIVRLLNLPDQVLYALTETYKTNLNSVWSLVHSLHHAFVDDGDWSIVREVNEDMREFYEGLDMNPPLQYTIKQGDWVFNDDVEAILIYEEDWDAIIDAYMLHIDFYEANKEAVESDEGDANDKYWKLHKESDKLYAKWFEERLWER